MILITQIVSTVEPTAASPTDLWPPYLQQFLSQQCCIRLYWNIPLTCCRTNKVAPCIEQ